MLLQSIRGMGAKNTGKRFRAKGFARSTEKAFLGRLYERAAEIYLRKKRLHILRRNLRCKFGELDLIAWDRKRGVLWVVEVRGRQSERFRPSRYVTPQKLARLRRLCESLRVRGISGMRLLFLEVTGIPRFPRLWLWIGYRFGLNAWGVRFREFFVEGN